MVESRMRVRGGFTLIELLVATGVFIVGFVAVFGLFLAGMRFRKLAEDTTRMSLAASSLIAEIQIDAGAENPSGPYKPIEYVGDGFAAIALASEPPTGGINDELYHYRGQPGIWYCVSSCTDLRGLPDNELTTALRLKLFVMTWATGDSQLDFSTLNRRLSLGVPDAAAARGELVKRGLAMQFDAVILRRPSWLK